MVEFFLLVVNSKMYGLDFLVWSFCFINSFWIVDIGYRLFVYTVKGR